MPGRLAFNFARSNSNSSPQSSSSSSINNVADSDKSSVVTGVKLLQTESISPARQQAPRPAFTMDGLFHPHKDKIGDKDRDSRKDKRRSLIGRSSSGSKSKERNDGRSSSMAASRPLNLEVIIESPPLVLQGTVNTSSGALLSGRLKLNVVDPAGHAKLVKLTLRLRALITAKKPVSKDCPDCTTRTDVLKDWNFVGEPRTFSKDDDNQFPFSFLFPGHLPATTLAHLAHLQYDLSVRGVMSSGEVIHMTKDLKLQRAIAPGPDKTSVRIFPPTNLTGKVILPPVIHPIGTFPVQMTLSGVVEKKNDAQTRWRLRKLMWRIEEHEKVVTPACPKHAHKIGGESKGVQHVNTRIVGNDELRGGWKTDFDTMGGEIYMEFDANVAPAKNPLCDVDSPAGLEVTHNLVIELIVAEEFCPNYNTRQITPTGAARVLRMQFRTVVTDRMGLGVAWDEEMPPVYEDVPASPPGYRMGQGGSEMRDYEGEPIEYTELERLETPAGQPPTYIERTEEDDASVARQHEGWIDESSASAASRPSGPRFTVDDFLGAEPPQYAIRPREERVEEEPAEDVEVGQAA